MKNRIFSILMLTLIVGLGLAGAAKAQNYPNQISDAASVSFPTNSASNYFSIILSQNTTFAFSNAAPQNPMVVTVIVQENATGGFTFTGASNVETAAGTAGGAVGITTTASKYTILRFTYDTFSQLWYTEVVSHN